MDQGPSPYESLFENVRREIDPKQLKKAARVATLLGAAFLLLLFGFSALVPWTEYLWFSHDARHAEVFRIAYGSRGELFSIAFFTGWVVLYANLRLALNVTMVFLQAPTSKGQLMVTNAIGFIQSRGAAIVRFGAPALAFLSAIGFSEEWSTWMLARHAQSFHRADPVFGLDLGFFVFKLPWYRAVCNFTWALLLLTTLATVGIYAGLQGMASLAKIELGGPKVRAHIHSLVGLTIITYGVQTLLKTYEIGLVESAQFTGAGLAATQGLWAQRFVGVLALAVGLGSVANGIAGKPFTIPIRGVASIAAVYVLGVLAWPGLVQRFYVDPDRLSREAPYAEKAIGMTRYAYGLDKITIRNEAPQPAPTSAELSGSQSTLDNMRLWDPTVLRVSLDGLQAFRPYYKFYDVDIDRYMVGGKQTVVMLSPRQIYIDGLLANARNWTNERLRYTHGYGVVVTRVDDATSDGQPVMLDNDIPQKSTPEIAVTEPRIYFGDQRDENGHSFDEYSLVDTGQAEFDYPTADSDQATRWEGDGGIPIGSPLTRLAFSIVLGDGNLLVSPEIKSVSRLLIHRNVLARAGRVYPFLKFESDPYIVIRNGKIFWILDGYTTSDMVPYSALYSMPLNGASGAQDVQLNYVRNSVKVAINAYTGEMTAYAVQADEPILSAWREVYPGLVKDASEIPEDLRAHFRYPEELVNAQSVQLCTYHVTSPSVFLGNGDLWNIASQRGLSGDKETIQPFYVELELPDSRKPQFVQILPFTPNARINMSGWLAAGCDPGHYGELTLYVLDQATTPIAGPEQMEGKFSTTPEISNINRQFQNQTSNIVVGNLIVVPIGRSFMYAESLFLQSNTQGLQAVPQLTRVILALNNKVIVAPTYRQGLVDLFGAGTQEAVNPGPGPTESTPTAAGPNSPPAVTGTTSLAPVKQILDLLDQADVELRKGDFAKYGDLQRQARDRLKTLLKQKS